MDAPSLLLNRFLLALCVWREARGESYKGKQLVAATILNRASDPKHRWPQTPGGVVLQPMQFSSFNANDANAVKFPSADAQWTECVAAVDSQLELVERITPANHYHVIGLSPAWRDDSKVVASEGHHVFYLL